MGDKLAEKALLPSNLESLQGYINDQHIWLEDIERRLNFLLDRRVPDQESKDKKSDIPDVDFIKSFNRQISRISDSNSRLQKI